MPDLNSGPFELSDVLGAELATLASWKRPDFVGPRYETWERAVVYRAAYQQNFAALCLSGGGIRSASFSLGVSQALAEAKLLNQFNYLSTVSGGGYIGSWLSAWLYRAKDAREVLDQLCSSRKAADNEPAEIAHLRDYSSYLTPQIGLFSADTWTAVAIILRNLLVNGLILIPALSLLVVAINLIHLTPFSGMGPWLAAALAVACLIAAALSLGYKLSQLYSPSRPRSSAQGIFLWASLLPAAISSFCFTWLAVGQQTPAAPIAAWLVALPERATTASNSWWAMLMFGFAAYVLALLGRVSRRSTFGWGDGLAWLGGVTVFAIMAWLGVVWLRDYFSITYWVILGIPWFFLAALLAQDLYLLLRSSSERGDVEREWLGRASGWHFIAALVWLVGSSVVLLGPELYYYSGWVGQHAGKILSLVTTASGFVTALLGKSSLTGATGETSRSRMLADIGLAIAGPLFVLALLVLLSLSLHWLVYPETRNCSNWACYVEARDRDPRQFHWIFAAGVLALVMLFADFFANINAFSLHALYRNRLVRAFLGGSRPKEREPDAFTGFDWNDELRVASLWHDRPPVGSDWRPFHVINMALNLASPDKLAWQQRKAMSFIVTPKFCGTADLGYRNTADYGNPVRVKDEYGRCVGGMTLGTAMAISGAAVSPSMGYHSSPSAALLLTLFNVRLGCWLGNPGAAGEREAPRMLAWLKRAINSLSVHGEIKLATKVTDRGLIDISISGRVKPYEQAGPWFALKPLLTELFGATSNDTPYVYLSDGGHFEDLGLYEMVRRRCKWIVVVDGDADPQRGFVDLGDAVRKCWIDLGVRIRFADSDLLQATKTTEPREVPYYALGTVEYVSDDPTGAAGKNTQKGYILYIKPTVRGDEWAADIIAYQRANPDFPHQTTADQWFNEPQLEAYRALGYLITARILEAAKHDREYPSFDHLCRQLKNIDPKTLIRRPTP